MLLSPVWCRRSATLDVHDVSAVSDVAVADILAAVGVPGVLAVDCAPDLARFLNFASFSAVAGDPPNAGILAVAGVTTVVGIPAVALQGGLGNFWPPAVSGDHVGISEAESKEKQKNMVPYVDYNLTLCPLQSRLRSHTIYHGQPHTRVDFIFQSGT